MLCTYENVLVTPGNCNVAARPVAWVNSLIGAASEAAKQYMKRDIELTSYTDFYSGEGQRDLVLRQFPVWAGNTYLDSSMNGVALPQATITVSSTAGFHPGTAGNPNAVPPAIAVLTGINSWSYVTYTGTTATTFTGCSGGSDTMATNPGSNPVTPFSVTSPVVHFDPQGYGGQRAAAFGAGTQLAAGTQYYVVVDVQGQGGQTPLPLGVRASKRGLLRNCGGAGSYGFGWQQPYYGGGFGRLAGNRGPCWPQADQGIRVMYTAGFLVVPFDIQYAVAMLVNQMIRIQPQGENLSSEGVGGYSYSVLISETDPAMGTVRRTLARYREPSFAMGS